MKGQNEVAYDVLDNRVVMLSVTHFMDMVKFIQIPVDADRHVTAYFIFCRSQMALVLCRAASSERE